jgi:hypothetical protein
MNKKEKIEKVGEFLFNAADMGEELCKMGYAARLLGNHELSAVLIDMGETLVVETGTLCEILNGPTPIKAKTKPDNVLYVEFGT